MYHYVRKIKDSQYPKIKGLEESMFNEQIAYLMKQYSIISGNELIEAMVTDSIKDLPQSSVLLTFDDGYSDHYQCVLPILRKRKITGCFFPVVNCVKKRYTMDANKIHYILACTNDVMELIEQIFSLLNQLRSKHGLESNGYYWGRYAKANRFDSSETVFVKGLLQKGLPNEVRREVIDILFKRYVTTDELTFADNLYMSQHQIEELKEEGMYIGNHGQSHQWLNTLEPNMQAEEIQGGLSFMQEIGMPTNNWIMCYPYGAYDDSLLALLRTLNCRVGLTTDKGLADLSVDNPLTLRRLDTTEIPL